MYYSASIVTKLHGFRRIRGIQIPIHHITSIHPFHVSYRLSNTILLVRIDREVLGRRRGVGLSNSPELALALGPPVLHLDVPLRVLGSDNRADLRVVAGLVGVLARSAGAGGVKARGVLGANAGDVEGVLVRGAGDVEVADLPGQGWAGTALGESLEGSREGEGREEGEREELHGGRVYICTGGNTYEKENESVKE